MMEASRIPCPDGIHCELAIHVMATITYGGSSVSQISFVVLSVSGFQQGAVRKGPGYSQAVMTSFILVVCSLSKTGTKTQCGLKCSSEFFRTSIPVCTHVLCIFTACRKTPAGMDSNL